MTLQRTLLVTLVTIFVALIISTSEADLVGLGEYCSGLNSTCVEHAACQYAWSNTTISFCLCVYPYYTVEQNGTWICDYNIVGADEECTDDSRCTEFALCRYQGNDRSRTVCDCWIPFVPYRRNGSSICVRIITSLQDPLCSICESKGGKCYDMTDNQLADGCSCGPNCEVPFDSRGVGDNCTTDLDCPEKSSCQQYVVNMTTSSSCACVYPYVPILHNGSYVCEYGKIKVGDICSSNLNCISDAECRYDGSNTGVMRCLCRFGYVRAAIQTGVEICAAIITPAQDPLCYACESNGGVCYDTTDNQLRDGCVCSSFRSGYNCQVSYVNVTCNPAVFTMTICYKEQDQYLSSGAVVFAEGKALRKSCRSVKINDSHSSCAPGYHQLVLPLRGTVRDVCGTQRVLSDIYTVKYYNTIVVQHELVQMQPVDVSFVASCSYNTHASGRFHPIGVAIPAGEKGQHLKPNLIFYAENHLGQPIPDGVALRLGDQVRFGIKLIDVGTYAAIRVLRCLASSKSTLNDLTAVTLPLVLNSCPSQGQSHITVANNWSRVSRKFFELRTGLVRMFKMSNGRSLHIHCTVKLCLKGFEEDCRPIDCASIGSLTNNTVRNLRRKRSTSTVYTISKTLYWTEDEPLQSSAGGVADVVPTEVVTVIIGVIGVVTITLIAILTSLILKKRQETTAKRTNSRP